MCKKKYGVTFCSEIGKKHIEADTQKEIIQLLKNETPQLLYKYPWTHIFIQTKHGFQCCRIDTYGYEISQVELKTVTKFLKSKEWQKLWIQWCY